MHTDTESTRKSCLILLFLCVVTVAISMGWTALSCLVGEANSNACVDFSHNIDFYFGPVRRGVDILTHWLSSSSASQYSFYATLRATLISLTVSGQTTVFLLTLIICTNAHYQTGLNIPLTVLPNALMHRFECLVLVLKQDQER